MQFAERQNPKSYILNHGDIKTWHGKIFKDAVPLAYYAGNYRGEYSGKPCLNGEAEVAGVRGALAAQVEKEMTRFSDSLGKATIETDKFLATNRSSAAKVQAAVYIAAFAGGSIIRIHPFVNGNGTMARLVMDFFLHRYLGVMPLFVARPMDPAYGTVSQIAMRDGNFIPLYQYLVDLISRS